MVVKNEPGLSARWTEEPKSAVMVTGAAGFVGTKVVQTLAEQSRQVVAVYHHKLPESLDNVFPVCSDLGSPELMAAPLRGVDSVVHLAWESGLAGPKTPISVDAVTGGAGELTPNLKMLRHLLRAMERAKTRRIVFLSAVGARPDAESAFLREKYWAEFLVLNAKIPEKAIIRSSVLWGAGGASDRFLRSIIRVMRYPVYPLPRKDEGIAPVHVGDMASMLVAAATKDLGASGAAPEAAIEQNAAILDVHGGERYQLKDIFRIVSDTYVKRTRIGLGGMLGASLLNLVEREVRDSRLGDFLALGGAGDDKTYAGNPLSDVIPPRLATFRERIHG
jgi:NADH dehydrogenase